MDDVIKANSSIISDKIISYRPYPNINNDDTTSTTTFTHDDTPDSTLTLWLGMFESSFEETTDMLINASIFAEYDNVNGVSANVMLGQQPPCGTGDSQIMLDEEHMVELLKNIKHHDNIDENDIIEEEEDYEVCLEENLRFNFKLPQADKCFNIQEQSVNIV